MRKIWQVKITYSWLKNARRFLNQWILSGAEHCECV